MISYECRTCGGTMEVISKGIGRCTFCSRVDSMPTIDSEKFNRAERLRRDQQYFDEAADLYRQIIAENPDEEEAYWGLVLCKFGIEYVEDVDKKLKPTCHRTIETSILDDTDYILACQKASDDKRKHYEEQAKEIQKIQSEILEIVAKERPYDVFISYKSKDDFNNPSLESNEAKKIFHKLDKKGYRVFFAEETLVTGKKYEPQIYAALKTSRVMILLGCSEDNLEARWVKNEWKRFKRMMDDGENKLIIPVCIDMDPYELPMEIKNTQAIIWKDAEAMSKLLDTVETFIDAKPENLNNIGYSDIEEIIKKREHDAVVEKIDNAKICLQNGSYEESIKILDDVIRIEPDNSEAYWLRLCSKKRNCFDIDSLQDARVTIGDESDYKMAIKYASEERKKEYQKIEKYLRQKCTYIDTAERKCRSYRNLTDREGQHIINCKNTATEKLEKAREVELPLEIVSIIAPFVLVIGFIILAYLNSVLKETNPNVAETLMWIALGYMLCAPAIVYSIIKNIDDCLLLDDVAKIIVVSIFTCGIGGALLCIARAVKACFRIVKRKMSLSKYEKMYEEICKSLDERTEKMEKEIDALYDKYSKFETDIPFEKSKEVDLQISIVKSEFKRFIESVSSQEILSKKVEETEAKL